MHLSIIGSGYVGLVSGAGLAEAGHDVLCMDIDAERIDKLRHGHAPIYEPGLDEMLVSNAERGLLSFTTSMASALEHAEALVIAVGTPASEDGSADLGHVLTVARNVGQLLSKQLLIIVKSTVPVGTCDRVRVEIQKQLDARDEDISFSVASNPEFLAEGTAIKHFMQPDRIICGVADEHSEKLLREMYAPFNRNHEKMIFMDVRSSELTKYSANAMLATRISLMNELANIADRLDADIEAVRRGIGMDPRIGYHFIYPGAGYGGSCFPKDVRALARSAAKDGYDATLMEAVEDVNNRQKNRLFEKLSNHYDGNLKGKTIALWGLSFKAKTDDMREASSRVLMEALWEAGSTVQAYDPEAMNETKRLYPKQNGLKLCKTAYDALKGADALVVVTEWQEFRSPDFELIKQELNDPVIIDGRNLYDPGVLQSFGITYYGIGRGQSVKAIEYSGPDRRSG